MGEFSMATTQSERDWESWVGRNVDVRDGGLTLQTTTSLRQAPLEETATDLAVDPSGVVYLLRASGALYRYDPETDLQQRLLKHTAPTLSAPTALCASADRVFVADSDGSVTVVSPRLQRTVGTLDTAATDPRGIAYADGTLYVLEASGAVCAVDRSDPRPRLAAESVVSVEQPFDIVADRGRVFVLDGEEPAIRAFWSDGEGADAATIDGTAFSADGRPFTPKTLLARDGTLLVSGTATDTGNHGLFEWDHETGAFRTRHWLSETPRELVPAETDGSLELYGLFGEQRDCRRLAETKQYAPHPERERHVGTAFTCYDAGTMGTEWHRLVVETAQAAASTQLRVRYLASETRECLPLEDVDGLSSSTIASLEDGGITDGWDLLTRPAASVEDTLTEERYQRVRTATLSALTTRAETEWTTVDSLTPREVLLTAADGRYLFVALELVGSPASAPRVETVDAYCPRQSYLRYLPELYQEDSQSAAFLHQYLSVFESVFVDIESEIEGISRYFDPQGVPSESLAWLEGWLGVDADQTWPEQARREVLARAPELYRKRGTKAGLRTLIELYLRHADPRQVSAEPDRELPFASDESSEASGPTEPAVSSDTPSGHRLFFFDHSDLAAIDRPGAREAFAAALPSEPAFALYCGPFSDDSDREVVEDIVTTEKPAHVGGSVVELDEACTLDGSTFLGINSRLEPREFAVGSASLGENTVLQSRGATR